jgi:hypothetical protein
MRRCPQHHLVELVSKVHEHDQEVSRMHSFIRFSEYESLSLDMIRWLVT